MGLSALLAGCMGFTELGPIPLLGAALLLLLIPVLFAFIGWVRYLDS
jgi:hypothetical protein